MKTIRVGSRSSCPSNHASRAAFTALPQPLLQFRQRNVALGGYGRKDQLGMRLDPLRMAVAALALGPNIALAPFLSPPPDRARRTDAKIAAPPLDTTIRPQSRQRHACEGQRIRIWPCTPAPFAGQKPARSMNQTKPIREFLRFNRTGKCSSLDS